MYHSTNAEKQQSISLHLEHTHPTNIATNWTDDVIGFYFIFSPPSHGIRSSHLRDPAPPAGLSKMRGSPPHAQLAQLGNSVQVPGDTGNWTRDLPIPDEHSPNWANRPAGMERWLQWLQNPPDKSLVQLNISYIADRQSSTVDGRQTLSEGYAVVYRNWRHRLQVHRGWFTLIPSGAVKCRFDRPREIQDQTTQDVFRLLTNIMESSKVSGRTEFPGKNPEDAWKSPVIHTSIKRNSLSPLFTPSHPPLRSDGVTFNRHMTPSEGQLTRINEVDTVNVNSPESNKTMSVRVDTHVTRSMREERVTSSARRGGTSSLIWDECHKRHMTVWHSNNIDYTQRDDFRETLHDTASRSQHQCTDVTMPSPHVLKSSALIQTFPLCSCVCGFSTSLRQNRTMECP